MPLSPPSCLVFHLLDPSVFRKDVYHRQQITIPAIVLGNVDHFDEICCPLLVDSKHHLRGCRKPATTQFVQGVPQISFQDLAGMLDCDLVGFGESNQTSHTARGLRILEPLQQPTVGNCLLSFSLLHSLQMLYTHDLHRSNRMSLTRRYSSNEFGCLFNHKI